MIKVLETIPNFTQLSQEILEIVEPLSFKSNQLMVQGLSSDPTDLYTGLGRIEDLKIKNEQAYNIINPLFEHTLLAEYIKKYKGYRTRIMSMPGRHCYSVHPDPSPRIHIPIVTNIQAWMIWPYQNKCYQLSTGSVYWTDTRKYHTYLNGDEVKRIHVVMCVC